ncbi:MAG: FAD-binding and (Fe-S)-binding domain-containing protein, partial [Neisseriaceae bacterium]
MSDTNVLQNFKHELLKQGFKGRVLDDMANRVINSTDNSIYEVLPLAIIQPKSEEDVELLCRIANYEAFQSLSFTARGGGTGTNGQALTSGIVVDMSRYMTRILELNQTEKTIIVEPGVVLSQLNQYLVEYGLFFAPNVSTENRATIGGMIANDSAGKGSLVYGKTSDHILELSCVLIDGSKINIQSLDLQQLAAEIANNTKLGKLSQAILNLVTPVQDEINKKFPTLKRPLSGYNLKSYYDGNKVDLNKIIAGSEGTLAFITKAKLNLLPIPKYKALVITHYASFLDALDNVQFLLRSDPLAIETVDEKVQKSASTLPSWVDLAELMGVMPTENLISNFTEFKEYNKNILDEKLSNLEDYLQKHHIRYKIVQNNDEIKRLWNIRSLAVGLVGKMPGKRKPVAFVEDALVPSYNLRSFVVDFRKLLENYGLDYAMYGHSDVGCVHLRPALDMTVENDRSKVRIITEDVIKLTDKYNGILWGEHGKGYRGEFVEHTFGAILYPILQKIKALFDPHNRLNPGKLVTPYMDGKYVTKIDQVTMRGEVDQNIVADFRIKFAESMLCNGNAACFNLDSNNVMCPSYKGTEDRIHSPKGRAMMVKEWLRNRSLFGNYNKKTVDAANSAFNAMEGCLGCKGCSGKCPTSVSIPDLRTKFYSEYYKLYKKFSLKRVILANLEKILIIGAKFPKLWNFIVKNKLYPSMGMVNVPLMSIITNLKTILQEYEINIYNNDINSLKQIEHPVVILSDVFTGFLNEQVLIATCKVLKFLNYTPIVIY